MRVNLLRLLAAITVVLALIISLAVFRRMHWLGIPDGSSPVSFAVTSFLTVLALAIVVIIYRQHREGEAARARLNAVLESALDGIVIVDRHGHIVLANTQVEQTFGYDWRELAGKSMDSLGNRSRVDIARNRGFGYCCGWHGCSTDSIGRSVGIAAA
ncbi:MAG: PAS domain S-box protein [Planctomycetes bacterium]|nr:PAS domain S-box protein [Planctomycetota bacterium]